MALLHVQNEAVELKHLCEKIPARGWQHDIVAVRAHIGNINVEIFSAA
jgi:hypothetical protein